MGMYTEIYVNVDLKPETPPEIIEVLKAICGDGDEAALEGKPGSWCMLFNSGSYYTPNTSCANLTYSEIGECWSLLGKGDIKNCDNEIEQFFAWLSPWIDAEVGDFIGYTRYEESPTPTLVLLANGAALGPAGDGRSEAETI